MSRVGQGPRGSASTSHEGEDRLRETVRDLLGSSVRLSEQLSTGDVGLYSGAPHSATGLAYALHGRASVVSIDVATKLASFEDPIKSIMPVAVHSTNRIIVKRKYDIPTLFILLHQLIVCCLGMLWEVQLRLFRSVPPQKPFQSRKTNVKSCLQGTVASIGWRVSVAK